MVFSIISVPSRVGAELPPLMLTCVLFYDGGMRHPQVLCKLAAGL